MRKLLFALQLIAVLMAASLAKPTPTYLEGIEIQVHNYIDDLVRKALEYIRSLLQKHDPFPVPDMPQQTVIGDNVNLIATFNNLLVSNASDFTVDNIENNILGMWAKFGVTVPSMHLEGGYTVMGKAEGKVVTGNGNFKLNIVQLKTNGYVKVGIQDWWLQMTELDIDYTIQDLSFTASGLVIEGMSAEEIDALFSKSFLQYFQNNEKFVSQQVSTYVQGIANGIMRGKNLKQLLQWLKDIINGNVI
ncbi:Haemolymph juvenile hormone Hypothetical protein protein (JHBP) [Nesidiocoris tenuis]|uniref:Lipid-binding serum glycoprotein N-terminal domain-containing protein n=1 Tax=Nesidiocoris tenuis TaxID=355587 RepID=A0ABN7A8Z0_9HEMI|nr:Haemolymph juvenile hormone Hypothetical protein protein (JHBP) [Nesidiocoris tenuis]